MSPPVPLVASVVWVVNGEEHIDTVALGRGHRLCMLSASWTGRGRLGFTRSIPPRLG